ncbi:hypothetical protein COCNU_10G008530 [Cocos nucifera]|uniref:Uncharacterized protein n=1 Tax=Cocos nucifera TaxID=13894 RepID=A0A8K0N962_COCNU|nr:hypothetical protein COCNU_10G008530 [Cocos nucifera]
MGILEGKVCYENVVANIEQEKVIELNKELVVAIASWRVTEVELMESKEKIVKEKSSTITEGKHQAMEEYKASEPFEIEIVEGSLFTFTMGFNLYKTQVARLFLGVDVGHLNPEESKDKAERMVQMLVPLPWKHPRWMRQRIIG